jgi:indole-3-glycerol phosphate synthase
MNHLMTSAAASSDFLAKMAASSHVRLAEAQKRLADSDLRAGVEAAAPAEPLRLSAEGFDLIAEVKKRSPSAGKLASSELSLEIQAGCYASGGAAALSVLTEPERFDGQLADLAAIAASVASVPAMRKDFMVSSYQVLEARASGAGGVLLIAAILDQNELKDMLQLTHELGMFALVEAFDADDLDHCVPIMQDCGPPIVDDVCRTLIGINCRDLRTLQVDFDRFSQLIASLPADIPGVAESGIESIEQAVLVAELGYAVALVGTALMTASDPESATRAMIDAGRAARKA